MSEDCGKEKIGLVVPPDFNRTFVNLGMLDYFAGTGFRTDYMIGGSGGALAAAFYAAGHPHLFSLIAAFKQMKTRDMATWKWNWLYFPSHLGSDSVFDDSTQKKFFERNFSADVLCRRLKNCEFPVDIAATNLQSGRGELFRLNEVANGDDLYRLLHMSWTQPGLWRTGRYGAFQYTDAFLTGGLLDAAVENGCSEIIVLRGLTIDHFFLDKELKAWPNILNRSNSIIIANALEREIRLVKAEHPEIKLRVIDAPLKRFELMSFKRFDERLMEDLLTAGREAAHHFLKERRARKEKPREPIGFRQ